MTATVQLGIIHRNRLFRECLAAGLSLQSGFSVVDLDEQLPDIHRASFTPDIDVCLVDLALPNGSAVDVINSLQARTPAIKVIALVSAAADDTVLQCVAAGAEGCILEDVSLTELQDGIRKVVGGETYCSHGIMHSMFRHLTKMARESHWRLRASNTDLTSRELEILELISDHQTNKQIAKHLSVSLHTVKNHVHHILEKLQVQNRSQAADVARHQDWLPQSKS